MNSFLCKIVFIKFFFFRILSNWALKGVLNDRETGLFIQSKPDIEDEDINSRMNWNSFIINKSVDIPIFLDKYKDDILQCGKTINFFNKFNDLVSIYLPAYFYSLD